MQLQNVMQVIDARKKTPKWWDEVKIVDKYFAYRDDFIEVFTEF